MTFIRPFCTLLVLLIALGTTFDLASASDVSLDAQAKVGEEKDAEIQDDDDGWYCCEYDWYTGHCYRKCYRLSTGAAVGIGLSSLLFFVAVFVLCCYCCACCCFKGRRQQQPGQVYQAHIIVPPQQQQNAPPGYFYGGGGAAAQPAVSIVHNHQYPYTYGQYGAAPAPAPGFHAPGHGEQDRMGMTHAAAAQAQDNMPRY